MLQTLLLVAFTSLVTLILGLNLTLFYKKSSPVIVDGEQLVLAFFSGLTLLAIISSWISLFSPLSFWILSPAVIAALLNLLYRRKLLQWKIHFPVREYKFEFLVFLVVCILFIQLGSLSPYMPDTRTYHLQIVSWYQQFKTVPGIVNLFPRYGFYSNWFHLVSSFSFSPNQSNLHYLNTALSIWFTFFLFIRIATHRRKADHRHHFFALLYTLALLFMFIGWNLLRGSCQSMNYDLIVISLILYIFFTISENRVLKTETPIDIRLLIILAASIPFYKPTGAFSLIALFIFLVQTKQLQKQLRYIIAVFVVLGVPYLVKNYIQSGYLFFPFPIFDIFSPDWKLPEQVLARFNEFITLSNQYIYESVPDYAWQHSSSEWLDTWFFKLATYDKILLILAFSTSPLLLFYKTFKRNSLEQLYPYLLIFIPVSILWFIKGPDPRYLYGYIIFNTFVLLSIILLPIIKRVSATSFSKLAFLCILLFSAYKITNYKGLLLKALGPETVSFTTTTIGNTSAVIPDINKKTRMLHCDKLPIPCIFQSNPYLQMRGESIESGFRMNTPVDSSFIKSFFF